MGDFILTLHSIVHIDFHWFTWSKNLLHYIYVVFYRLVLCYLISFYIKNQNVCMAVCMHASMSACIWVSSWTSWSTILWGLKMKCEASCLSKSVEIGQCCKTKGPLCETNTDCRPGCGGLPASSRLSRELRILQSSGGFSPKDGKAWESLLTI